MAREIINVGSSPNDGTGDPLRTAFTKCNANFGELYNRYRTTIPSDATGATGDTAGTWAADENWLYYCFADYDGTSEIWRRIAGSSF